MDAMAEIKQVFFQECEEQLFELEAGLLTIERGDEDPETVNAVFRAVHSIKGGAGAFNLTDLVHFAHVFENTMDLVRTGKLDPTPPLIRLMLRAADILADLVRAARDDEASDPPRAKRWRWNSRRSRRGRPPPLRSPSPRPRRSRRPRATRTISSSYRPWSISPTSTISRRRHTTRSASRPSPSSTPKATRRRSCSVSSAASAPCWCPATSPSCRCSTPWMPKAPISPGPFVLETTGRRGRDQGDLRLRRMGLRL